eukprot:gene14312-56594_t
MKGRIKAGPAAAPPAKRSGKKKKPRRAAGKKPGRAAGKNPKKPTATKNPLRGASRR